MNEPATKQLLRKVDYAKHRGVNPSTVTRWIESGRLVLDGKRVDVVASDAMLAAVLDPARGGPGGSPKNRKALNNPGAEKAAGGVVSEAPPATEKHEGRPRDPNSPTSRFQEHRSTREEFAAMDARLRYMERAGALVSLEAYEAAIRQAMAPIVAAIDSLAPQIAQAVVGLTEIRAVEAAIEKEVETIRANLRRQFETLLSEPDKVRQ